MLPNRLAVCLVHDWLFCIFCATFFSCHATGSCLALVQDDVACTIVLHVHLLEVRRFSHRYAQKTVCAKMLKI